VYRAAQTVICISGRVRQILQDGVPSGVRSTVVYNGADPERFSPGVGADSPACQLLAVGNLIPSKGHDLLLRAIHRLLPSFADLQCHIVGEGPERARLESLARDLAISPRIHFLGRQSREAVAAAMRRCSVFVLPSRSEGLGCVYLEAMSCAKAVIACRGQGIEEVIEHGKNGWLISPDSLDELVHGLSTLLSSDVSSRLGLAARETIKTGLTLGHQAQRLLAVYREALPG
jgi:glycosyltransferase involved in cell wall biosynthesis